MSHGDLYSCVYNGEEFRVYAICNEEAYWKVLNKNGIYYTPKTCNKICEENKMEINIA